MGLLATTPATAHGPSLSPTQTTIPHPLLQRPQLPTAPPSSPSTTTIPHPRCPEPPSCPAHLKTNIRRTWVWEVL